MTIRGVAIWRHYSKLCLNPLLGPAFTSDSEFFVSAKLITVFEAINDSKPEWETFQTGFAELTPGNKFLEMTGITDEGTGIFNVEFRFDLFLRREPDSDEIDESLVQLKILLGAQAVKNDLELKYLMLESWEDKNLKIDQAETIQTTAITAEPIEIEDSLVIQPITEKYEEKSESVKFIQIEIGLTFETSSPRKKVLEKKLSSVSRTVEIPFDNFSIENIKFDANSIRPVGKDEFYVLFLIEISVLESIDLSESIRNFFEQIDTVLNTRLIGEQLYASGPGTLLEFKEIEIPTSQVKGELRSLF